MFIVPIKNSFVHGNFHLILYENINCPMKEKFHESNPSPRFAFKCKPSTCKKVTFIESVIQLFFFFFLFCSWFFVFVWFFFVLFCFVFVFFCFYLFFLCKGSIPLVQEQSVMKIEPTTPFCLCLFPICVKDIPSDFVLVMIFGSVLMI